MTIRVRLGNIFGAWVLLLSTGVIGQQPVRDAVRPVAPGTATVTGVVIYDGSDPRPARGVIVNLTHTEGTYGDTTVTDEQGRFTFGAVPAGRYTLWSQRSGYVTARYGAARAGRAPTPIAVADGDRVAGLTLKLVKGAVLAGTIRNVDGEPAPDVHLGLFRVITAGGIRRLSDYYDEDIGARTTNDRGEYRIYGLPAGDYALRAMPERDDDLPSAHQITPADIAWARAVLARPGTSAAAGTPAQPVQEFVSYSSFYYPGTPKKSGAATITLGAGEERTGLDFQLSLIPTFRVTGTVTAPQGAARGECRVFLIELGSEGAGWYDLHETYGPSFTFEGIPPGNYAVAAIVEDSKMWAMSTVAVSSQDQQVRLSLQPGLTASGQLIFRGSSPPPDFGKVMVTMSAVATGSGVTIEPSSTKANADGTFTIAGMMPAGYRLAAYIPSGTGGQPTWYLQSALVGTQDIADYPLDVRQDAPAGKITVTFTDKPTELSGRLEDPSGRSASDCFIIVFSPDERTWSERSRRIVQTRPGNDGRFVVRGLPPGDYLVAALTDVEQNEWYDPGFLRELVPTTAKVTLGEGEHKTLDLRIR